METMLKHLPQCPSIGEDGSDLVGEIAPTFEAEVCRLLPGKLPGQKLVQHVRSE